MTSLLIFGLAVIIIIVVLLVLIPTRSGLTHKIGGQEQREVGDTEFPLWVTKADYRRKGPLIGRTAYLNKQGNEFYKDRHGERVKIRAEIYIGNRLAGLEVKHLDGAISSAPIKDFWIDNKLLENIFTPSQFTQLVSEFLFDWKQTRDYYGPSWDGIEKIHWQVAYVTPEAAVEAPRNRVWYRYPSSQTSQSADGKDWRLVIPNPPSTDQNRRDFTNVNMHSILHNNVWTLTTTVYDDDNIDSGRLRMLSNPDFWTRSMLWSIETTKVLEESGFDYTPAREDMEFRLRKVRELTPEKEKLTQEARQLYRQHLGGEPDTPYITLAINDWLVRPQSIGMYFPPTRKHGLEIPFGIVVIDSEALHDPQYTGYVLMHEIIHSLFGQECNAFSHHARFRKIADLMGLPKKYQD